MKASGRENSAVVEFTGKVQRIAQIHQYGLKDRPNAHNQKVQYVERKLLGITESERNLIERVVMILICPSKHYLMGGFLFVKAL